MKRKPGTCNTHGFSPLTFACKHIASGQDVGFVFDPESTEPWPVAVCDACADEPPWTDEVAVQRLKTVCSNCWENAFERHAGPPASEREWFQSVFPRALEKQERWQRRFRIGGFRRYQYSFEAGQAWLAFGDGGAFAVRCDAHVIGSWSRRAGTWLWGWANRAFAPRTTAAIVPVKRRGERERIRSLWRSGFEADEADAGGLVCAVLDTVPEIEGFYRSPSKNGTLFLAVTRTRWQS